MAFGTGHGGIEAVLLGGLGFVNFFIYSVMINTGTFDQVASKLPPDAATGIKDLLMAPPYTFLLGGVERLSAFMMQLGFLVLVLYSVRERKTIYLLLAVLLHALMDFPAALYQMKYISNLIVIEIIYILMAVIAVVYVVRAKEVFKE
jgi:uncharacterized membrane protein YhfC